jgi:hypothetical protein
LGSDENHANAGAAHGHRGREGRQMEECRMQALRAATGECEIGEKMKNEPSRIM